MITENKKPLIYFVDDEPDLLELFSIAVESDFDTMTFGDPESFVQQFEQHSLAEPDLLVSDLLMPKLNGLDMLIQLREKTTLACPVILLSGHLSKDNLIVAMENGVEKVLEKPCDLSDIRAGIHEILYKTEIRHIRADVRNTARKICELADAIEKFADQEMPSLGQLLDGHFLSAESLDAGSNADSTFRDELHRLESRLNQLIEQERLLEKLQKVS